MANLVERIRNSLSDECIATGKYRKKGCSVSLKDAPTLFIMIDVDKLQLVGQNEPKCDYILLEAPVTFCRATGIDERRP